MWQHALQQQQRNDAQRGRALFRRLAQYYALANEEDYKKNGQWRLDLLEVDIQLYQVHRRHAQLPDLDEDEEVEKEVVHQSRVPVVSNFTSPVRPAHATPPVTSSLAVAAGRRVYQPLSGPAGSVGRVLRAPVLNTPKHGPYNGNKRVEAPTSKAKAGPPAARPGPASAFAARVVFGQQPGRPGPERLPSVAQAELEKIQGFIDTWNLDPFDTKRCIAKLPPARRQWLLETYDGSVSVKDFLTFAPADAHPNAATDPRPGTLIRSMLG